MTTTYQYGSGDDAVKYTLDYSGDTKVVLEKNPFLIPNKKVSYYTISGTSTKVYPLQLVDESIVEGKTLNATLEDTGKVKVLGVGTGGSDVDISDTVLNAVLTKGKNQPYSYVVLTISKQLYLDLEINLVQKSTKFALDMYGMNGTWVYERLEDRGAAYDITLVSPAYYLKTITLLSLFNFTISGVNNDNITLTNVNLSSTITWNGGEGTFSITFDTNRTLTFGIKRVDIGGSYQYTLTKLIGVKVDDLFAFLSHYVAQYAYTDIDIQQGYYYNYAVGGVPDDIHSSYTMQDIEGIKATKTLIPTNNTTFNNVTLRLDEFASDILESLALLSNRVVVFDDKAYFKPIDYTSSGNISINWQPPESFDIITDLELSVDASTTEIANTLDALPALSDAQEGDTVYVSYPDSISCGNYLYHNNNWTYQYNVDFPHVLSLAENDDQGSQYVLASQKVQCEAYEATVAISDTTSTYVAQDLVFPGADNTDKNNTPNINANRNNQAKIIALNSVVKNYKPGDCIVYSVNETTEPTITLGVRSDLNAPAPTGLNQGFIYETYLPGTNDSVVALSTPFVSKLIDTNTYAWFEYDTDEAGISQYADVMSCASQIIDEHNGITLTDVPVALIEVEYPACLTTYTWGMPEFMDEQGQFNDLSAVSQDSTLDNTSDTSISSSDATKIVVGNQYVHQLQDNRTGFTGLIMEKNADNNVYRLVGYNNGVVQAQFNSEGKIEAGAGIAQLDADGLTVYYDSASYVEKDALKFRNKSNPQIVPYRLFATYDSSTFSTKSTVQAISQTINNQHYPATLEMLCDLGGATNSFIQLDLNASQTTYDVSSYNAHAILIIPPNPSPVDVSIQSGLGSSTVISTGDTEPQASIVYPITITSVIFSSTINPNNWKVFLVQNSGWGGKIKLSSTGTEITGSVNMNGDFTQSNGFAYFSGMPKVVGNTIYKIVPAMFDMPIYSTERVITPLVSSTVDKTVVARSSLNYSDDYTVAKTRVGCGTATYTINNGTVTYSVNTPTYMDQNGFATSGYVSAQGDISGANISASGYITTSYRTINTLACRRIVFSSNEPSTGQPGDIWVKI